jgi:hypothetical protein
MFVRIGQVHLTCVAMNRPGTLPAGGISASSASVRFSTVTTHLADDGVRLDVEIEGPASTPAAVLAGHRPVVEHWDRITVPTAVALPGDHLSAAASREFTDVIIEGVRSC